MDADRSLDCTGLVCPLPVLRARKVLSGMAPGQVLAVSASDPAAPRDFEAFCAAAGHVLLGREDRDGVFGFRIRRGG
ncbi:sulfurtransferase TusA family protein [Rhodocista pekingensis]|uniref:Sulfurtransferase TusA family protein n=1 Tax=Rhodocista pekingensis TaxID=201185 RepID=A0ABW2KZ22_9PROT